jgi:hypothetical protein
MIETISATLQTWSVTPTAKLRHYRKAANIDTRPQSSRLAEFGGRGMSFNICRGTLGSLAMFALF